MLKYADMSARMGHGAVPSVIGASSPGSTTSRREGSDLGASVTNSWRERLPSFAAASIAIPNRARASSTNALLSPSASPSTYDGAIVVDLLARHGPPPRWDPREPARTARAARFVALRASGLSQSINLGQSAKLSRKYPFSNRCALGNLRPTRVDADDHRMRSHPFLAVALLAVAGCADDNEQAQEVASDQPRAGKDASIDDGVAGAGGKAAREGGAGGSTARGGASGSGSGGAPSEDLPDGTCVEAGASCESSDCCEGNTCIEEALVCAANCESGDECQSGCCAELVSGGRACAPPSVCANPNEPAPPVMSGTVGCGQLVLLGDDGQFLGNATSNAYATDGVCNQYSPHGSAYAADSIYNPYGTYGSKYSSLSAYDPYTSTPPVLFCSDSMDVLNPVTKNSFLAGAIDPDALCAVLAQNGL